MTSMDKAGIGLAIGITALFVAFAGIGGTLQSEGPSGGLAIAPQVTQQPKPVEPEKAIESQKEMEEIMQQQRLGVMEEEKETQPEPEPVKVTPPKVEEPVFAEEGPKTVNVSMPTGTSVPGCEETNECFIPASVTVNVGDTVSWSNDDTAAHTVTSGTPTDGPDGIFDSSLLMAGNTFEVTFDNSGGYDYFCMVHPWMVGDVQVN